MTSSLRDALYNDIRLGQLSLAIAEASARGSASVTVGSRSWPLAEASQTAQEVFLSRIVGNPVDPTSWNRDWNHTALAAQVLGVVDVIGGYAANPPDSGALLNLRPVMVGAAMAAEAAAESFVSMLLI